MVFQNAETGPFSSIVAEHGEKGAAPSMNAPFSFIPARYAPFVKVVPVFTLPPGYLELSLTVAVPDCSYQFQSPLTSGESVTVGAIWS
jgi:hypothetical protein